MEQAPKRAKFTAVEPAKKTYFFQYPGGEPFATEEKEAWELLDLGSNWRRKGIQFLGASDGTIAFKARLEASKLRPTTEHLDKCTLETRGQCSYCESLAEDAKDIIRKGVVDELEEAKKNPNDRPRNQNMQFMGASSSQQQQAVKNTFGI